jgi:hypothetical protein
METKIEIANIETKQVVFEDALVLDVELKNGESTQIITFFNHKDFHFEEMKIGLDTAINRIVGFSPEKIKSVQTTLNKISKAGVKPFLFYGKTEF